MKLHSTGERRLIKKQVEEALHPGRKGLREFQRGLGSLGAQGWGGVWMGDASSMRVREWGRERELQCPPDTYLLMSYFACTALDFVEMLGHLFLSPKHSDGKAELSGGKEEGSQLCHIPLSGRLLSGGTIRNSSKDLNGALWVPTAATHARIAVSK